MKIQSFKTIASAEQSSCKEKGSEFIARIFPIQTIEEFQTILHAIKKEYHDASHHCYAVNIIEGGEKYSDDGEPSGTAGIRILNAINHHELNNAAIVVVRYFGGTKLGVGPLGMAYSRAAMQSISSCRIIEKKPFIGLTITIPFEHTNKIYHLFSLYRVKMKATLFSENVTYNVLILYHEKESFLINLNDVLKGKSNVIISEKIEYLE